MLNIQIEKITKFFSTLYLLKPLWANLIWDVMVIIFLVLFTFFRVSEEIKLMKGAKQQYHPNNSVSESYLSSFRGQNNTSLCLYMLLPLKCGDGRQNAKTKDPYGAWKCWLISIPDVLKILGKKKKKRGGLKKFEGPEVFNTRTQMVC